MNTKTILGISFAAIFVVSMIFAGNLGSAEAKGKHSPDLRIEAVDLTDGTITITSAGTAGGTIPDNGSDVYAYIVIGNDGDVAYALASHDVEDSGDVGSDLEWHGHLITGLGADHKGVPGNCITSLEDAGIVGLSGSDYTLDGTSLITVDAVLSVVANVDRFETEGVCIKHVFDSWFAA